MVVGAISAGEKVEELPSKECQSTKAKLEGRRIANNNRRRPSKMIRRTIVWCLCCLLQWFALTAVQAQTIGDDVCGCSPRSFTFNLDLSLTCPPTNITSGGPVAAVSCIVSPFGAPSDDLTPIVVESISILELDQSNSVLIEERIDGNLLDGDSFTYTSVLNDAASIESSHQIPQALQLNLNGRNIDGVILLNVFIVTYSNRCGMVPVITEGHSTGWVVFVSTTKLIFSVRMLNRSKRLTNIIISELCRRRWATFIRSFVPRLLRLQLRLESLHPHRILLDKLQVFPQLCRQYDRPIHPLQCRPLMNQLHQYLLPLLQRRNPSQPRFPLWQLL